MSGESKRSTKQPRAGILKTEYHLLPSRITARTQRVIIKCPTFEPHTFEFPIRGRDVSSKYYSSTIRNSSFKFINLPINIRCHVLTFLSAAELTTFTLTIPLVKDNDYKTTMARFVKDNHQISIYDHGDLREEKAEAAIIKLYDLVSLYKRNVKRLKLTCYLQLRILSKLHNYCYKLLTRATVTNDRPWTSSLDISHNGDLESYFIGLAWDGNLHQLKRMSPIWEHNTKTSKIDMVCSCRLIINAGMLRGHLDIVLFGFQMDPTYTPCNRDYRLMWNWAAKSQQIFMIDFLHYTYRSCAPVGYDFTSCHPMCVAVQHDYRDIITRLKMYGYNYPHPKPIGGVSNGDLPSDVLWALEIGSIPLLKLLLYGERDMSSPYIMFTNNDINVVVKSNHPHVVDWFMNEAKGHSIDIRWKGLGGTDNSPAAIRYAIAYHALDVLKHLYTKYDLPISPDDALAIPTHNCSYELLQYLHEHMSAPLAHGIKATIMERIGHRLDFKTAKLLIDTYKYPAFAPEYGADCTHAVYCKEGYDEETGDCKQYHFEFMKFLVDHGGQFQDYIQSGFPDVNSKEIWMIGAGNGNIRILQYLKEHKVPYNSDVLDTARMHGHDRAVEWLCENMPHKRSVLRKCMNRAITYDELETVRYFHEKCGIPLWKKNKSHREETDTALWVCSSVEILRYAYERGYPLDIDGLIKKYKERNYTGTSLNYLFELREKQAKLIKEEL